MARAKSGQSRTPTKWTSAARTTAARSLRLRTGSGLFEGLWHGLIVQQIDLVERAEVDGGGDLDAVEELPPGLDGDHRADRDAAREDAVDAGGQHAVAGPHLGLQGDVVELQPAPPAGAAHHPLAAGAQDHAAHRGGAVGEELDLGIGTGDGDHPADQPAGREHRLVLARPFLARVEDHGAQPRGVVDVDDVDRPDAAGGRGGGAHGVPQAEHLPLDVGQPQQAQAQDLDLLVEAPVLLEQGAAQLHPLAGVVEPFGDRRHAAGHGAQQAQAHGLQPRLAGPRPLDRQVDELAHQHDDQHPAGAALVHSLRTGIPGYRMETLRSRSMSESTLPVPSTTEASGSSASTTGRPVSSRSRWSRLRSSAPPPERTIPLSMMSADSSGGVRSRAMRTASTMVATGSASASRISSSEIVSVLGTPSTRSRPLISILSSSLSG